MRSEDFNLATLLRDHWQHGNTDAPAGICTLIGDADALLDFLEANHIRPSDAIDHCPACGQMHRWTLLRILLEFVVAVRPSCSGALPDWTRARLEEERTLPGSSIRDYRAPSYVTKGDTTYQTLSGSSIRDYSKPTLVEPAKR